MRLWTGNWKSGVHWLCPPARLAGKGNSQMPLVHADTPFLRDGELHVAVDNDGREGQSHCSDARMAK